MYDQSMLRPLAGALLLLTACTTLNAAEQPNTLTEKEIADGWILLFDGETDFGWKAASKANWKVADGAISVSEGEKGLLCTTSEFGNYVLKVDFRAARGPIAASSCAPPAKPTDPAARLLRAEHRRPDDNPFPTGSFVELARSPTAAVTSGEWQSFEVQADGATFHDQARRQAGARLHRSQAAAAAG